MLGEVKLAIEYLEGDFSFGGVAGVFEEGGVPNPILWAAEWCEFINAVKLGGRLGAAELAAAAASKYGEGR